MSVIKLVAALAIVIALAACGRATEGGGAAPTPTPTPISLPTHPAGGFDVLITDQDRDVAVHVGQKIEVFLRAKPGMDNWSGVQTDAPQVLAVVATGIMPVEGATITGFVARSAGVANITAYASPRCAPNQACPMYAMLFQVRVVVTL